MSEQCRGESFLLKMFDKTKLKTQSNTVGHFEDNNANTDSIQFFFIFKLSSTAGRKQRERECFLHDVQQQATLLYKESLILFVKAGEMPKPQPLGGLLATAQDLQRKVNLGQQLKFPAHTVVTS